MGYGHGPHLNIGVRRDVAWNLGEPITCQGDIAIDGNAYIQFTVLEDADGNLLYPPFDFAQVVESWRDLPRLL